MKTLPNIDRRAWLALWAQRRRRVRVRAALATIGPQPVVPALLDDLFAYWKLDEAAGMTRRDSSGNGQDMMDVNGDFGSSAGIQGNAASNGAEYGSSQLAADLLLPFAGAQRSVSWWMNVSSAESTYFQIFLLLDGGDYTNEALQCYTNGGWEFNIEYFGNWTSVLGLAPLDEWIHFVATTDGDTARLYLNGAEIASDMAVESSPMKLWIGNYYEQDRSMVGGMDEVGLWTRCLTPEEVGTLYNFGSGLPFESF